MPDKALPPRSALAPEHTWDAASVFASDALWEAERDALRTQLPNLKAYRGRLGKGPDVLADYLAALEELYLRVGKVYVYASIGSAVDTADQAASARASEALDLFSSLMATASFAEPEMLAIGQPTINAWLQAEPRLAIYAHYFDNLFRRQQHVRSAEVEEVLGLALDPLGNVPHTAGVLANADLKFDPATTADGEHLSVEQGNILSHRASPDRTRRRTSYESYSDGYLRLKNTFASNLATAVKGDVFYARARRFASSLEASLYEHNIPVEVFHNLIDVFRQNLPTWHRYWALRRRALGVETLHSYDVWAPLTKSEPDVPYEQAVEWIVAGLRPLDAGSGADDYSQVLRHGALEGRWVDRYPNQNKRQGAFSSGSKGTLPFIVTSYHGTLSAMSTLAHELGHSMHSYLTWQNQPVVYADYSLFVAEVASNFNQAVVRAHLLDTQTDPDFQIAVIEGAMSNFHRYFFLMPTLARFELEVHERAERGQGLTADGLIALMADLIADGYGDEMHVDRERDGILWAQFGHLYANFYVFQYATGISAAHALADRVLHEGPTARDAYLSFLKAGGSLYPLDALRQAGVDMTSPEPVEKTFKIMADYVDRLGTLLGV